MKLFVALPLYVLAQDYTFGEGFDPIYGDLGEELNYEDLLSQFGDGDGFGAFGELSDVAAIDTVIDTVADIGGSFGLGRRQPPPPAAFVPPVGSQAATELDQPQEPVPDVLVNAPEVEEGLGLGRRFTADFELADVSEEVAPPAPLFPVIVPGEGGRRPSGIGPPTESGRPGRPGRPNFGQNANQNLATNEQQVDDDSRYFFTQPQMVVVTTSAVVTTAAIEDDGTDCWKCDAMSYSRCAAEGYYQECELGDRDCCFVEVREKYGKLRQLCTGCKNADACEDLKQENFNPAESANTQLDGYNNRELTDQCRPGYELQLRARRYGAQQSVCRQCFQTCKHSEFGGAFCFGSINENEPADTRGAYFDIPIQTRDEEYDPIAVFDRYDVRALGIPTYAFLDSNRDFAAVAAINNFDIHNVYFAAGLLNDPDQSCDPVAAPGTCNGKKHPSSGDNVRQLSEMTYWGLQGTTTFERHWWESDLKLIQRNVNEHILSNDCEMSTDDFTDPNFNLLNCMFPFDIEVLKLPLPIQQNVIV